MVLLTFVPGSPHVVAHVRTRITTCCCSLSQARALRTRECALVSLTLDGNSLGDTACCELAAAIATQECSLTSLNIASCDVMARPAPRSAQRALLMPQVHPGSLVSLCGKSI